MNTVKILKLNNQDIEVDACIAHLIKGLNDSGFKTIACCCGHGNRPGYIRLEDGRELMVVPDFETARKIERMFGNIHGTSRKAKLKVRK